jgi:dipeptidase E
MRISRQIIALGGGGFSRLLPDPKMCAYILGLARVKAPRICFVPTAGNDDARLIQALHRQARRMGARPSHLSVFALPKEPLPKFLSTHDVIWVSGGNTRNLLLLWRAWGVDAALRAAYERGIILAGASAGALCWFGSGVTDSYPGRYQELRCLGWLRGSFCPHYNSEPKRRPVYRRLVADGVLTGGYAADDNVGLHYVDGRLSRIVSSKPGRRAHRLARLGNDVRETTLVPDLIM